MKIETQEVLLRKMIARQGYVFKQARGNDIYGNVIYLSVADTPDNYIEITEQEAAIFREQLSRQ